MHEYGVAVVKRYETDSTDFCDWHFDLGKYHDVYMDLYEKILEICANEDEAVECTSWCEFAIVGGMWDFENGAGEVEILFID